MKQKLWLIMLCVMQACSSEASWWSSLTQGCSSMISSVLSHKVEIKGVKAPTAGVAAGVVGLLGLGYAGYRYYQDWRANQPTLHKNLQGVFSGMNKRFEPKSYAQDVISPGVMQEMPNGLFVVPCLQQIGIVGMSRAPWNRPGDCADMSWAHIQENGEGTYCGYHALFAAQQMLHAYDNIVGLDYDAAKIALENLSSLDAYLRALHSWVPAVKVKRETLGEEITCCSWLTSDEFNGNEAAGFSGLISTLRGRVDHPVIACDSLEVAFDPKGADFRKFLPVRRVFAESHNAAVSLILPATCLDQGLNPNLQTHWINFTVMKINGVCKIFFADSLLGSCVGPARRDAIYDKIKSIFSCTEADLDMLEQANLAYRVDVHAERLHSDISKSMPNESMQYKFVGFVQTDPMELYDFHVIDELTHGFMLGQEEKGGRVGFVDDALPEGTQELLKSFLRERFASVERVRDVLDGVPVCLHNYKLVQAGIVRPEVPKRRLFLIWENTLDSSKLFFTIKDASASATDEDAQVRCLPYKDINYVVNGIDRELPAEVSDRIDAVYECINGDGALIEVDGRDCALEALPFTPKLCASMYYLIAQMWVWLGEDYTRMIGMNPSGAGDAAGAATGVRDLGYEELRAKVAKYEQKTSRLMGIVQRRLTDEVKEDAEVKKYADLCVDIFHSLHQELVSNFRPEVIEGSRFHRWQEKIRHDLLTSKTEV